MPQDGSNNYQYPPGTPGIPDTTIESEAYNTFLDDLVINDLNIPRPIHRGGTGASTADAALVNLKAEKAEQVVTAYLSQLWMPGSFRSAASATDAPVAGHAFAGVCYINEPLVYPPTNANVVIEARDEGDTTTPGRLYIREKKAGVWGAWTLTATDAATMPFPPGGGIAADNVLGAIQELATEKVDRAGDTMTGSLILPGDPVIALHAATKQYVDARVLDQAAYSGMQINGSMEVSQELGAGGVSLVNGGSKYACDGFTGFFAGTGALGVQSQQAQVTPGFSNSFLLNCTTANPLAGANDGHWIQQSIEGYRWSRLAFGKASAQPVTISFWVYPNVAGTMAIAVQTPISPFRTYVADVAVTALTWQYKTVTIPGDTNVGATWAADNRVGGSILFVFGVGSGRKTTANAWATQGTAVGTAATTNFFAATGAIYLTGVTVLPGSYAPTAAQSPNIMRPYDQELLVSKRYWQQLTVAVDTTTAFQSLTLPVEMRSNPTVTGGGAGFTVNGPNTRTLSAYQTSRATQSLSLDARL